MERSLQRLGQLQTIVEPAVIGQIVRPFLPPSDRTEQPDVRRPIAGGNFRGPSLPLDCPGRLAGYVVRYPVNPAHLVDDPARHPG